MLFDHNTFEHKGRTFRVEFPYDDSGEAPWDRSDMHGPVTDWTTRGKQPGERVLHHDRGSFRYYDMQEATRIAKRDGWGLAADDLTDMTTDLGRTPTKGEIVAQAVERDFEYLRRWCNDQWSYVGVVVRLDDEPTRSESVWGIESDAYDYLEETAHELADQICAELDEGMAADITASRPDLNPDLRA